MSDTRLCKFSNRDFDERLLCIFRTTNMMIVGSTTYIA